TGVYFQEPASLPTNFFGITNYAGCAGFLGLSGQPYAGVFVDRAKTTIPQITAGDGTSNTAMFGEALGNTRTGTQNWNNAWIGSMTIPSAWGLAPNAEWYRFGSNHTAVTQFAYSDGAVHGAYTAQVGGPPPDFSPRDGSPGWSNFI